MPANQRPGRSTRPLAPALRKPGRAPEQEIRGVGSSVEALEADMAKAGCEVTVFEAFHVPGGVLRYGIPDFKLEKRLIDRRIAQMQADAHFDPALR